MLSFNQFIKTFYIIEGLNPDQKKVVDSWGESDEAENISGHVIPKGQSRITIPLEDSDDKIEPHPDVKAHLESKGYNIHDYKKGLALEPATVDQKGNSRRREVKIGKALEKTGASDELKKTYLSHSNETRKGARASGLQVVISRHPHDVAAMSTGQGWESCMTMGKKSLEKGGSNSHYLIGDVKHGTHVAYLTKAGAKQSENPADNAIARIALKPFHGSDGSKILHPENAVYGDADSSFEKTVGKWAKENFPLRDGVDYEKHPDVYDDSNRSHLYSFKTQINHPDPAVRFDAFAHDHADKITPEHITNEIAKGHYLSTTAALRHPMANRSHVQQVFDHPNDDLRKSLSVGREMARHADHDQLSDILDIFPHDHSIVANMTRNPEFGEQHIHELMRNSINLSNASMQDIARHKAFNSGHVTGMLNDYKGQAERLKAASKQSVATNKLLHTHIEKHIRTALKVKPEAFTDEHLTHIVNSPHHSGEAKDLANYQIETRKQKK